MSHRITRRETHSFDLTESERFEEIGWRKTPLRVTDVVAEIVDGSLSRVELYGYPVLKSGALGQVRSSITVWKPYPQQIRDILGAHGIKVPS
jgi:hypothetical protein